MMTNEEFERFCLKLGYSKETIELIVQIRCSEPVRLARGRGDSVVGIYPSLKMQRTLQFESHHCELSFIQSMERDKNVLELWDQPIRFNITYVAKNGRKVTVPHVPDFFVCQKDYAGFVECKTEEKLISLAEEQPGRYCRGEDGLWHSPPAEEYARQFSLRYDIHTSANINPVHIRNMEFLDDFFREEALLIDVDVQQHILSIVREHRGISLSDLLSNILAEEEIKIDADDVYYLMIRGDIYVNLYAEPLVELERVQVFENIELAEMYAPSTFSPVIPKAKYFEPVEKTRLLWDNKVCEIVNVGEQRIWLQGEGPDCSLTHEQFDNYVSQGVIQIVESSSDADGYVNALERFNNTRPNAQAEAERRFELIKPYLNGEKSLRGIKRERSIRRYIAIYKEAQAQYDFGLLGLLPNWFAEGKSVKRLLEEVYQIMDDRITNDYESLEQKNAWVVYGNVLNDCEAQGIPEDKQPSYPTFCHRINHRPRAEQTMKRKGKRAAYEHETHIYWIDKDTPPHGDRPFHIVHADSTKINLELVCPITGGNLGRPWAYFLVDAFTRLLLAIIVTFDPPSYRTTMMLLRECGRRHKRLPQILIVDRGSEFDNTYLRRVAGTFQMTVKFRPTAQPRYGSVCERLFGIAQNEFIHNLMGNTQIMTEVRKVTKSINPKNRAVWTLGAFNEWFNAWGYEYYNKRPHWTLKHIPLEAFTMSLELTGKRRRRIVYDETFRILTMPTTRKQTAKNMVDKGVKVNCIYYWNDALRDRTIEGKQLHVRYDPFNISIVYVQVREKWLRCTSENYITFERCTERQLKIITSELRKRNRKLLRARSASAKVLADFITQAEKVQKSLAERRLMLQRVHDREVRPIFKVIDGGMSEQVEPRVNTPSHTTSISNSIEGSKESSPFETINFKRLRKLGELK